MKRRRDNEYDSPRVGLPRPALAAALCVSALVCAAQGAARRAETFPKAALAFSSSAPAQKPAQPDPTERQDGKPPKGENPVKQPGGKGREVYNPPPRPRLFQVTVTT